MLTLTWQTQSLAHNILLYDTVHIWNTVLANSTVWSIVNLRSTLLQWLTSAHACSMMNCGWLQSANHLKSQRLARPCSPFPLALETWNCISWPAIFWGVSWNFELQHHFNSSTIQLVYFVVFMAFSTSEHDAFVTWFIRRIWLPLGNCTRPSL